MAQRRTLSIGVTVNLDNYENLRLEVSGEAVEEKDAEDLIAYLDTVLSRLGRGTPETAERVDSYRRRVFTHRIATVARDAEEGVATLPGGVPGRPPAAPETPPEAGIPASTVSPAGKELPPRIPAPPQREMAVRTEPVSPSDSKGRATPVVSSATQPPAVSSPIEKERHPAVKKDIPPPVAVKVPAPGKEAVSSPPAAKEIPAPASSIPAPGKTPSASKETVRTEEFSCERCGEPITPVQRKLSRMFQNKDLCKKCLQQL